MAARGRPSKGERRMTSIYLAPASLKALKNRAFDERSSVTEIVENLVERYLQEGQQEQGAQR